MDWENERYVRTYTRDTTAMLMMAWDELSLFWGLLRKVDRAGILDLEGHGAGAIVAHLRCPIDVAERALKAWVQAGWVEIHGDLLIIPCHIEAQEAKTSDAQRQRNSREQRRAKARLSHVFTEHQSGERSVTMSDIPPSTEPSTTVTPRDENVTPCDTIDTPRDAGSHSVGEPSHPVTPCHPSLAEPSLPSSTSRAVDARARATPTAPDPMSEIVCGLCEGDGETFVGRGELIGQRLRGRCGICGGSGRHLAGGVDPKTIGLARLIRDIIDELDPVPIAYALTGLWTDAHTPEIAAKAFRQAKAEIQPAWAPERVSRLVRVFFENAPRHADREEGRAMNDRGRESERRHLATKTPEERRRSEGRAPRRDDSEAEQKLMSARDGAKMALEAMQRAQAEQARLDALRKPAAPDDDDEPSRTAPSQPPPRSARAPENDDGGRARPPTSDEQAGDRDGDRAARQGVRGGGDGEVRGGADEEQHDEGSRARDLQGEARHDDRATEHSEDDRGARGQPTRPDQLAKDRSPLTEEREPEDEPSQPNACRVGG